MKSGMMGLYDCIAITWTLFLTVHIFGRTALVGAQNTNFSFASFSTPESFLMVEDVQHYAGNASFLMNSRAASLQASSCGRLLYKDQVRTKDSSTGAVASFNTAFSFEISGPDIRIYPGIGYAHADGLAFMFATTNDLKGQDAGSSLCLIKEQDNGLESNRLFAVEFDTFPNYWWNDSSDSHIGVNINSMNSTWSYNLCTGNEVYNCTYLCNGGYFTAWIDYNSTLQKLEVYFANGSLYNNVLKPAKPLLEATVSLVRLFKDYMYVGFSSSTGLFSEVHQIQSWTFTSSGMPELVAVQPLASSNSPNGNKVNIIAGVAGGAVTIAAFLLAASFFASYWRRSSHRKQDKFNLLDPNLVPRMFTYKELSKATKNFDRSELLGSGGFGAVYKGTLPSGALVAVKRMKHESKHGQEGFQAEAATLSQIRHRNLVQLRGWCHEEDQLLLVYDFMCNGSLDEWLFQPSDRHRNVKAATDLNKEVESLPLGLRHSVLSGVAAALAYLHEECVQCVLHRDIKSSNVLLDKELHAYLGDFGLARLIDHQKVEKTTMMAGTLGYMAPEMPYTGKATKESDVYSFGVLMLEVMCGVRPLDIPAIEKGDGILVDRVWRAHEAGNILQVTDPRLGTFPLSDSNLLSCTKLEFQEALLSSITTVYTPDAATKDTQLITNLLHLGLLCCNPNPEDRPGMRTVSQLLLSPENMDMSTPPLPISKPRAQYSRPGFSSLLPVIPSTNSDSSSAAQSTTPSSRDSAEPANNMQTSFAAPDSLTGSSGR